MVVLHLERKGAYFTSTIFLSTDRSFLSRYQFIFSPLHFKIGLNKNKNYLFID